MVNLNALLGQLRYQLPGLLADRLWRTATMCCVPQTKMSVDTVQAVISKVLDHAESIQAQIISSTW